VTKPEAFRVEATLETARPSWGSDFDYTRFIGNLRTHHEFGGHFILDSRFIGGKTGDNVPLFKRFFLGGQGSLRGYDPKQFDGNNMAIFSLETSLVPGHHLPSLIPFYDGGRTWGPGVNPAGRWRSDVGAGLRWPARGNAFFVRVDGAYPLDRDPGQESKFKVTYLVRIPF
jgi:outer membrane protein insertion porin family